jgi:hypothetical protein
MVTPGSSLCAAVRTWSGDRWIKAAAGIVTNTWCVNWSQPWLDPYRRHGEALEQARRNGLGVADGLNLLTATNGQPTPGIQFVPSTALPEGQAYEAFIHQTRSVPTRDNLHDLFNGLVWWRFPRAKKRLNELQAAEIEAQGIQPVRGALRDALTLFDENAALLQAPDALVQALTHRDWPALFITHRGLWAQTRLTLFGHALMEKLVTPRKNITAHVWLLPPGEDLDGLLLQSLKPDLLAKKPFHPLPVLGMPGWWPDNENFAFYQDETVFRPATAPAKPHETQGQGLKFWPCP